MRKRRDRRRKVLSILSLVIFLFSFLIQPLETDAAMLAQSSAPIGNVVIFVKFSDDTSDIFNAVGSGASGNWTYYNWKILKDMYGSIGQDNTFTDYIYRVSEHKLTVQNFFPQEVPATAEQISAGSYSSRVQTLQLDIPRADYRENYGGDGAIIKRVAEAINSGVIPLSSIVTDASVLDGNGDGYLDNLTIIVQGDSNGAAAHRGQYASDSASGETKICGLRICDYNYIPSTNLVETVPSGTFIGTQQGVISHEFLHNFGFPDLYRSGVGGYPVGNWDIMGGTSMYIQYPLSYLRARSDVGWVNMRTVSLAEQTGKSATFTLTAVSENAGSGEEKVIAFRTPLSDSELIVMEYRKKSTGEERIERSVYESGLIAYRVNEGVDERSNKNYVDSTCKNYIYVYRPGAVDPEAAMETYSSGWSSALNCVRKAALGAGASYGSTDLGAPLTENTLFYSDGRNSGIRIKDVQFIENNKKVKFTVEWADYESGGWTPAGSALSNRAKGAPILCADGDDLYLAYMEDSGSGCSITVKKWNAAGKTWNNVGSVSGASFFGVMALHVKDGAVRLAYMADNNNVICGEFRNGAFSGSTVTGVTQAIQMDFVEQNGKALLECDYYVGSKWTVVLWDAVNGGIVGNSSLAVEDCTSVDAVGWNGVPTVLYCGFFTADRNTKLMTYGTQGWSTVPGYSSGIAQTNTHIVKAVGEKLYVIAGQSSDTNKIPVMSVYDGSGWRNVSLPSMTWSCMDMEIIGSDVYVAYVANEKLQILRWKEGTDAFQVYEELLVAGVAYMDLSSVGQTLYVAYDTSGANSGVGSLSVRQKTTDSVVGTTPDTPTPDTPTPDPPTPDTPTPDTPTPDTPTPDTPTPDTPTPDTPTPDTPTPDPPTPDTPPVVTKDPYQVILSRPDGYDACPDGYNYNPVYIDGVLYQPTIQGTQCKVQLAEGNTGAKVATMYCYQPSSSGDRMLPRGMRVWKLTCVNGVYSAEELEEYRDLLGYYGFAVRLTAPPGLRICSSIKMSAKDKMAAEGTLMEYGTLAIPKSLFVKYNNFVIGGRSVSQGRAYWKEGSVINDKRYKEEPANDRILFTSVLPDFPDTVQGYTLELYARPYVIVNHQGETLTIYGAPVSRQFYQVAKQAYDSGNRNSYIKHIVDTVAGE